MKKKREKRREKREERKKKREKWDVCYMLTDRKLLVLLFSFFILLFSFVSCDLFQPADPEFLEKIDAEVAWALAPKLTVTLTFPNEWGFSPNTGTNRCYDIIKTNENPRQGYPFYVEFTRSEGFFFVEWLAFNSALYEPSILSGSIDDAKSHPAYFYDAVSFERGFTQTGAITATITVDVNLSVTIVPFCDKRPFITNSRPPLVSDGSSYTRGQQITIWIDLGKEDQQLAFGQNSNGETLINITGQYISDSRLYNENGEEGDLSNFYNTPFYDAAQKAIIIAPKPNDPPLSSPPPGQLIITVTIGTGIKASNGEGMASPVSFSYRTGTDIVTRAYKANNVWAIHDPDTDSRVESFFYQTAPSERDRRLRKKDIGEDNERYEVTLYFTVSRSVGEIEDPNPSTLRIAQIYYADLTGELTEFDLDDEVNIREGNLYFKPDERIILNEEPANNAGGIYRYMVREANPFGSEYYQAVYTFPVTAKAGIYRLAVLPHREDRDDHIIDNWQTAVEENRFVTVVIDKYAPEGKPAMHLNGYSYRDELTKGSDKFQVYAYIDGASIINIYPDFSDVHDNGKEGGILPIRANPNLPWTMDEQRNLQWRYCITDQSNDRLLHRSDWLSFNENPPQIDVAEIMDMADFIDEPVNPQIGEIRVQFRDALENTQNEWSDVIHRIIYTDHPGAVPVTDWEAVYDDEREVIILSWTTPTTMTGGVRIRINETIGTDGYNYSVSGTGRRSRNIPAPKRNTGTNGLVTGIKDYEIMLTAIKDGSFPENQVGNSVSISKPIFITNCPGIRTTEENPLIIISTGQDFANIGNPESPYYGLTQENSRKVYVLKNNISLTSLQTPIGYGTTIENAFTGTIYGEGHTVTFTGTSFANGGEKGIFGAASNALIRDLNVVYNNNITVDGTDLTNYIGGIVGYVLGNTQIINTSVKGSPFPITLTLNTLRNAGYLGGIAGYLGGSSEIKDSLVTINLGRDSEEVLIYKDTVIEGIAGFIAATAHQTNNTFTGEVVTKQSLVTVTTGGEIKPYTSLDNAFASITSAGEYTVTLNDDQTRAGTTSTSTFVDGAKVTLVGSERERKIELSSNGRMFVINGNETSLTLGENIKLVGRKTGGNGDQYNNNSLVYVANGTFTMLSGSEITGNSSSSTEQGNTSAVTVNGTNAIFNMKGGTISGNSSTSTSYTAASGLFVTGNGKAILEGGSISGNTGAGGDIYVTNGNSITLSNTSSTGSITLFADSALSHARLLIGSNWTGSINALHLAGSNSDTNTTIGYWHYNPVISAASLHTITPADASKVNDKLGNFIFNSTASIQAVSNTHYIETTGDNIGRLVPCTFYVTNGNDSGTGSLRYAIDNAYADSTIIVESGVGTITLLNSSGRLNINKSLTIEGNGVTLTRASSWTDSTTSQLMTISGAQVKISRMHFKDGRATANGGAINITNGSTTFESCIFSGNQISGGTNTANNGGAIYFSGGGSLSIKGCTFYDNSAGYRGGAIYVSSGTVTLTGNLFYGNTAGNSGTIVYREGGSITSGGYNVTDVAYGTGATEAGFTKGTGDTALSELGLFDCPFNTSNFKPIPVVGSVLTTNIDNFPDTDFYGATRTLPGPAGAVTTTEDIPVTVTVSKDGGEVVNFFGLKTALNYIKEAGNYTVTISENQDIEPYTFNISQAKITLVGSVSERQIRLSSNGVLFTVNETGTALTLGNNITLVGRSTGGNGNANNDNSLVYVSNGTLTMLTGSKITGNTGSSSTASSLSAVTVNGVNAVFNMKGGIITGNSITGLVADNNFAPGGLYVVNNGKAILEGGSITENTGRVNDIYIDNTSSITLSETAPAGDLTLAATSSASYARLFIGENWTGNINKLHLAGDNNSAVTTINYWSNNLMVVAADGYTLTATDIDKLNEKLGNFIILTTLNTRLIRDSHSINTTGGDMGKLMPIYPVNVINGNNTGDGSLRQALTNAYAGGKIIINSDVETINLSSRLTVDRSLAIEGNGVTLTRAEGWTSSNTSQFIDISGTSVVVKINRMHFKDGRSTRTGAGVYIGSGVTTTFESCIFSGNQVSGSNSSTYDGGAIYTSGTLIIKGCTFYDNSASYRGGAIFVNSGTVNLTGNIFYGNTANSNGQIVYINSGLITSGGYNVTDVAYGSGLNTWVAGTGDTTFTEINIKGTPINPHDYIPIPELENFLPYNIAGFPDTDFYGQTRTLPGPPGAVHETAPLPVTVTVRKNGGEPDEYYELNVALDNIKNQGAGDYIVMLYDNFSLLPYMLNTVNQNITLLGHDSEREIRLSRNGSMFEISNTASLTIGNNITLIGRSAGGNGRENNNNSLVYVSNSTFTMETGSKITGNTSTSSTAGNAAAVSITGEYSIFNMNGGIITGNTSTGPANTVYSAAGGLFVTEAKVNFRGGSITGNTGRANDIYIAGNASITFSGTAYTGNMTLIATTYHSEVFIGADWTGSIGILNLAGSSSIAEITIGNWTNKPVLQAAEGYTLTADDVGKVTLGDFISASTINNILINDTNYICTTGGDIGKLLIQQYPVMNVTNANNTGTGSLRQAILYVEEGGTIIVNSDVGTISTSVSRLEINKSLTIEGSSVVLTTSMSGSSTSNILSISGDSTVVTIRRMHFKDGYAQSHGCAITTSGTVTLTLESCIFSGNRNTVAQNYSGIAVNFTGNSLLISGCTFYNNTLNAGNTNIIRVGNSSTVTMRGNLFYGNTISSTSLILQGGTKVTSYNVVDIAYGTGNGNTGWTAHETDKTFIEIGFPNSTILPFTSTTGPTAFTPVNVGTLRTHIPESFAGSMPATDFYGNTRTWPGAPGAVKQP